MNCVAETKSGARCQRSAIDGDYCAQHAATADPAPEASPVGEETEKCVRGEHQAVVQLNPSKFRCDACGDVWYRLGGVS